MPFLDEADPRVQYVMLKGEPGLRKSTTALSYPRPQYWFSWDQKMQAMKLPMSLWKIDPREKGKEIQFDDYSDWNAPRKKLEQLALDCPYNTLVFDSVTSCADMILRQTLKLKGGSRGSGQAAGRNIAGISVNELEDYNAESSALNELIALTKDIQTYQKTQGRFVNIILIAHVMEVTMKPVNGPMTMSRTIVTAGKRVAAKIPAYCSEVYHFGVKKSMIEGQGGPIICHTYNTGDDFARTALPLNGVIEINDSPFYDTHIAPAIRKLMPIVDANKPPDQPSKSFT